MFVSGVRTLLVGPYVLVFVCSDMKGLGREQQPLIQAGGQLHVL